MGVVPPWNPFLLPENGEKILNLVEEFDSLDGFDQNRKWVVRLLMLVVVIHK